MTTVRSMESTVTRKIVLAAAIVLAATLSACGGSTQGITATAPSLVSPIGETTDGVGSFSLLKAGSGKGHSPAPEIGETPEPDDPDGDADDFGNGHGHGQAVIQIEGFTESITEECPALKILFKDGTEVATVKTDELETEFQRATCAALKKSTPSSIHLHVAAKKMKDESLVAIYVRMQGPKFDDPDDAEE